MKELSNPTKRKLTIEDKFLRYCALIIETNQYAGNFERQMGAYITGHSDKTEIADEEAELAKREIPEVAAQLEKLVLDHFHESGDAIVASPYSTTVNRKKHKKGDAVIIYFDKLPNQRLLTIMKERAIAYAKEHKHDHGGGGKDILRILGFRLKESYALTREWYL